MTTIAQSVLKEELTLIEINPLDQQIGQRIQACREYHQFNRAELAAFVDEGCCDEIPAKYESGEMSIPVSHLQQMADALYTPIYFFIAEDGTQEWLADRCFFAGFKRLAPPIQTRFRQLIMQLANVQVAY